MKREAESFSLLYLPPDNVVYHSYQCYLFFGHVTIFRGLLALKISTSILPNLTHYQQSYDRASFTGIILHIVKHTIITAIFYYRIQN